jgi:ubiquinone/menaquinone biosynthesis C-methylase UbiE
MTAAMTSTPDMTPQMTPDAGAHFWDRIARKYAAMPVSDQAAYENTLARIDHHLKLDDHVLELGCGTGSTAIRMAGGVARYLATDFSQTMIEIAREKPQEHANLTFDVADMTLSGHQAGSYDAVLGFNLFHLVPDADAALARIHAVLKPGGTFISKTPCLASMWYIRPVIAVMRLMGKAPALTYFSARGLDEKIRAAGFELVEVAEHNKGTRGHFVVARKI